MNKYLKTKPLEALLSLFSAIIIISALVYRVYALDWVGVIISLILALSFWLGFIKIISKNAEYPEQKENKTLRIKDKILISAYTVLNLSSLYILWQSRSDGALVSPWAVVPSYFFIMYFLATIILLLLLTKIQRKKVSYLLIASHYLLSFIIAVLVYKIGYGYDPFIHQATMDLIDKQGAVEPKPFYYLGQYGLLIIIHKLSGLSLVILDKLLVPVIAATFLPLALNSFISKYFKDKDYSQILFLVALIIPFNFFILSTPQNLAFLFLLLSVIYSSIDYRFTLILALAACLIHPLAGIPALALGLLLFIYHYRLKINKNLVKIGYLGLFLGVFLGLPIAFYLSGQSQLTLSLNSFSSSLITLLPNLSLPYKETWILNLAYFYGQNLQLIITLLIISGAALTIRHHGRDFKLIFSLLMAIAVLGSYFLVSQLSFNLISYEQNDFAQRLLMLIIIFSFPAILLTLGNLTEKIFNQDKFYKISLLIFLSALITASLYISYPRQDHYYNSKAYAVSASDQEAVNWIENQTNNPYIVLANQQTGAVALRSFGFNRYYNNLYFYPIPTSSPLYQYFLDMVYVQANQKTMNEAMKLAQVDEAYFVLPKYWWAFNKVLAEAKLSADYWQKIGDGQIYIFKYTKSFN
ncbi:MAG: hypothetical protein WCJ57_01815 [Candidatus Falkowbacteria bacterium]